MPAMRALFLSFALVQPVAAEDWNVLVIGNPSRSAPTAFADSYAAAEAFRNMGIGPVTLQREIGADALAASLDTVLGAQRVLIYFAGPIGSGPSGPMLMGQGGGDPRGAISPLLARLANSGTTEIALLIEDCAGGAGMPGKLLAPELPATALVYMAASAGPAATCPAQPDRLTDRLAQGQGSTLQDRLAGMWIGATGLAPLAFTDRTEVPADIADSTVTSVAPVTVAAMSATEILSGTVVTPPAEPEPDLTPIPETAVFRPLQDADILAIPVAAGMPRPSIIVGLIRAPEPEPEPDLPQIAFDDVPAREALRTDDPALFQTLVEAGGLDPPPESLVIALQTELQRSGCYTAAVDGDWGNGSRRAVDRFAETAGLTPVTRDAEIGLYRQLLLAGEVECPAPVAETARATAPRPVDPAPAPARSAPAPAPAPDPAPPSGGLSNSALGGVFR